MLNEELYEELEHEFMKCRVDEDVDDVLMELAEAIQDLGIIGREVSVKEQAGHGKLEAYGICEEGEDGGRALGVYEDPSDQRKRV